MTKDKTWVLPEPTGYEVVEHSWIPLSDGVRLSVRLWLPEHASSDPVPAVLEYIPYRKRDSYRFHDNAWGDVLASHGVAFARVDVRGTGDSEGVLTDEYSEVELEDGVFCIDWLSRQPWCNGSIGMRGISWGAINTLQIAARQPPALKAIVPIAGMDNRFTDDAHFIGGTLGQPNLSWGVAFKTVLAAPPDPAVVGDRWESLWRERLEATVAIVTRWTRHQTYDSYWQRGSVATDYAAIQCPAYVVAGWLDPYSNPVGRLLEQLDVPRKGLVGPWGHTYPEIAVPGGVDWAYEELRWWAEWLLGQDTGIMAEPAIRMFMPYRTAREVLPEPIPGRWIAEPTWPPADLTIRKLWLNATGLDATPAAPGTRSYRSGRPAGLCNPEWLGTLPAEQSADDRLALVFDSAPLDADVEVLGHPQVTLRIAADKPVATVSVRITEVTPAGASWLVSHAVKNLTHRDSHDRPTPLTPGTFYDVPVTLHLTAHRFKSGNRLRVAVTDGLWPMTWPVPEPAVLTIATGASALELPIRPVESRPQNLPMQSYHVAAERQPAEVPLVVPDADGWYVYENNPPVTSYTEPDTGTTLASESRSISRIKTGAEQGSWRHQTRRSWQRAGWHCAVTASCEITASATTFTVRETLEAFRDDKRVYEHHSDETVARQLL